MNFKKFFLALFAFIFSINGQTVSTFADDAWWDANWNYRIKLTFSNDARNEALSGFPILVKLSSSRVDYAQIQDDADDLRFIDADGSTVLDYEIETYNEAGDSYVWVEVPQIADSDTDYVYLYYGNASATAGSAGTATWNSNYVLVQHLGDNPAGSSPQFQDSTTNNKDGIANGTMTSGNSVLGKIGNAVDYNGTSQYIDQGLNGPVSSMPNGSVEFWFDPDTVADSAADRYLFSRVISGAADGELRIFIDTTAASGDKGKLTYRLECTVPSTQTLNSKSTSILSASAGWYHAVAVWDDDTASSMKLYLNGVEQSGANSPTCGMEVTTVNLHTGRNNALGTGFYDGQMDELRVSNTARSAAWISATYAAGNDTLITYGSNDSAPGTPSVPVANAYDSKVNVKWTTSTGTVTDYFLEYKLSSDPTWTAFSDAVSTATSTLVTGLTNNSAYDFRVAASNNGLRSASSSIVSATPQTVISFVSPTISNGVSTTSSSLTGYASSTISTPDYFTFRLETSGGSLISHSTTSTRYGNYNIANLATTTNKQDLSLTGDLSGVVYVPTTNTLFTIHNNQNVIHEVTTAGVSLRTITCSSCNDAEDISLVSSVASTTAGGYDHTFLISTEDGSTTSHQIFRVVIHSTITTAVNRNSYWSTGISSSPATNNGLEGVAYNSNTGTVFTALEAQESSSAVPKIYEVTLGDIATHSATNQQICTNLNFETLTETDAARFPASPGYSDISGLYYEPTNDHLYVLSHMGDKILEVDVSNRSNCSVIAQKGVVARADSGGNFLFEMPEGISWDNTGDYLYVGTEADYWSVWRTTSYGVRKTFSGLSDDNYNLYVSVTDTDGITSTSTARAFSVSQDGTAPTITSISSDKTNGTYGVGEVIDIDVTFSENVTSTGNVTVTLETGTTDRTCTFTVSNSNTGTCNYTVQAGDTTSDLTVNTIGGTIADQSANSMSNFVPATNLAANKALVIDTTPSVISSVASSTSVTTATVTWTTDESSDSKVSYGTSAATYTTSTSSATLATSHSLGLIGLSADTLYYFVVVSKDAANNYATSSEYTLRTTVAPDTTAPVISSIASTTSATTATITWTTNESATSTVNYGATSSYGSASTSNTLTSSHSIVLTGLSNSTTYHFQVSSGDASYNYATSSDLTFTTTADTGAPSISSVDTETTATSLTFTWTTNELASSLVAFGPSLSLGATTTEADISPRVTDHEVVISNLLSCTRYFFRLASTDVSSNTGYNNTTVVSTTGCTGSASIEDSEIEDVTVSSGADISLSSGGQQIDVGVPANSTATSSSLTFQIKIITDTNVTQSVSSPTGTAVVDGQVYDLKAYINATTTLTTFNEPITITLTYEDADVSGIDESTLKIYRYNGTSWVELDSCVVDTAANTVTCTTTHFSVFGLFGTETSGSVSGSRPRSNNRIVIAQTSESDTVTALLARIAELKALLAQMQGQTTSPSSSSAFVFTKALKFGDNNTDVRELQKVLNKDTTTQVAATGPGSKGNETTVFGYATKAAVIKYQIKHNIIPSNTDPYAGFVGPKTREKLNRN